MNPSSPAVPPVIIIADRGRLKAFHFQRIEGQAPRLRHIASQDFDGPRKANDRIASSQTASTEGKEDYSAVERLTLEAEDEIRAFGIIANEITTLLKDFRVPQWAFAAPSEINGAILDGLDPEIRRALALNLSLDLVNIPDSDLLPYFQQGG